MIKKLQAANHELDLQLKEDTGTRPRTQDILEIYCKAIDLNEELGFSRREESKEETLHDGQHIPNRSSYYVAADHNTLTVTWERPLPTGLEKRYDKEGRAYYADHKTRTTSWYKNKL